MTATTRFGELLKQYRLDARLSHADLAARAEMSVRGISDLERGVRRAPHRTTLEKLSNALGLHAIDRETLEGSIHRFRAGPVGDRSSAGMRILPDLAHNGQVERRTRSPLPAFHPQPTSLLGREGEIEAISRRLLSDGGRLLTLTGPAGVGKTRLAFEVGRRVSPSFHDGVVAVDLAPVHDPSLVLTTIAQTVGIVHVDNRPLMSRVQSFFQDRTVLIILDNFEQVLPAAAELAELLSRCSTLRLLVTSRSPLRLQWEQSISIKPLPVPNLDQTISLQALRHVPSVALFELRSRARRPDFSVSGENATLVSELVVHLDGLPLAIELAAAQMNALPLSMIVGRLKDRLRLLESDAPDLPDRHRSLEAAVGWSYELLNESEQRLFRHLGVFVGRASLDAIEQVVGDGDEIAVLKGLASLAEKSLVLPGRQDEEAELYFGILETMREYARERLAQAGELADARARHITYLLDLAERAVPQLRMHGQLAWFERLEQEHDNFRIALRWLLDHDERETALRLSGALGHFWWGRGHLEEGSRWLAETLRDSAEVDPAVRILALLQAGLILPYRGEYVRSKEILEEAMAIAQRLHDRSSIAQTITYMGTRSAHAEEWDDSVRLLREALSYWEEFDDRFQIGFTLFFLGIARFMQGDYVGAAAFQTDAVAHHRMIGDLQTSGGTHFYLALAVRKLGDLPRAVSLLQEGLKVGISFQNRWLVSIGVEAVLLLVGERADANKRARLLGADDSFRRTTGFSQSIWGRSESDESIATLRRQLGRPDLDGEYRAGQSLSLEETTALAHEILADFSVSLNTTIAPPDCPPRPFPLSKREQEVLRLVAEGLTNKAIARRLFISPSTVSYHLTSIFNKLGVDTRVQALMAALQPDTSDLMGS